MARIQARYTKQGYKVAYIGPGTKDVQPIVDGWNARKYHLLMSHALSIGHGLNLQLGGNEIVWFGLTDNLRLYRQFNARLRRQWQTAPNVHVRRILARNTVDVPISKLLETKTATAEELRKAIEAYRKSK
jgi:SNF2 family DNA or RNA helicase